MRLAVLLESAAEEEWHAAAAWYERQEAGVGHRFNAVVKSVLNAVSEQPDRFPKIGPRIHKATVIGWPYAVYFATDRRHREIKVVAIWHGHRNPAALRKRLR